MSMRSAWPVIGVACLSMVGAGAQASRPFARPAVSTADPGWSRIPSPNWSDVRVFRQAMKSGAEDVVNRFVNANRYVIVASLAIDRDAVIRGAERVRFTNRTSSPLSNVLFRLYPNTAVLMSRMNVTHVNIDGHPVEPSFSQGESIMTLALTAPLAPKSSVNIAMDFEVTMTSGVDASCGPHL
jgi:hypothetical protein